jgi:hypothetical protein
VLVGLANYAGPDDTGAFPSVATLVRYTGLSERTVRTGLDRAGGRGHHRTLRPGHRRGPDQRADRLEAAGAFVVALAARRSWFCYQQLFAVLLRFERRRTGPAELAALGRALSWARAWGC